jgi:hypothetical protein
MADPKVVPYCTYYEVNRGYVILYHYKKGWKPFLFFLGLVDANDGFHAAKLYHTMVQFVKTNLFVKLHKNSFLKLCNFFSSNWKKVVDNWKKPWYNKYIKRKEKQRNDKGFLSGG